MEQSDDSALKLGSPPSVDCGRAETLPNNVLADVGGNEQGDTRAETIA